LPVIPIRVCREATQRPVFGVAEAGVLSALARGDRFGVIAVAQRSIGRHLRYLRQMCVMDRFAGERPLNMSVAETASGDGTLAGREQSASAAESAHDGASFHLQTLYHSGGSTTPVCSVINP
jgi:Asp/Glu/hydantoin racemase